MAFDDASIITLICGARVIFWFWRGRTELGGPLLASRWRARWHGIPEATRFAIGVALLRALVGAGLAALLTIPSN